MPDVGNVFTAAEKKTLIEAGVTPLYVPQGGSDVQVVRAVSSRDNLGIIDDGLMDVLDYTRDYCAAKVKAKLGRASIVSDTANLPPVGHVTRPKHVRSLLRGCFDKLEQLGYLTDVDDNWEQVVTELDGSELRIAIPTEMVPQLHNVMIRLDATV